MKIIIDKVKGLVGKKVFLYSIPLMVVIILIIIILSGTGDVTVDVETTLKEVIESSDLKTATYTYNSIAEVKEGDKTKYYVSYKGDVSAMLDFDEMEIDKEGNKLIVSFPGFEVTSSVDPDLEYIFIKKKYDKETTSSEAYNICCEDLQRKALENTALITIAKEGAEDVINGLVEPFREQMDVEVVIGTEVEEG